jgi:glucan phosphoethanolaminetransferase (alkaline phosphatase superfamily)
MLCVCVCVGKPNTQRKGFTFLSRLLLIILILVVLILVLLLVVFLLLHIIILIMVVSLISSFWFYCICFFFFMKFNLLIFKNRMQTQKKFKQFVESNFDVSNELVSSMMGDVTLV